MINNKIFRDTSPGFSDLINWAAVVDPGIVMCKDGSLVAGWFYHGPDSQSATAAELNYITEAVNGILAKFDSGWVLNVDTLRSAALEYDLLERSHFPDPVTLAIERERANYFRQEGNAYESVYALTLTYRPPLDAQTRVVDMMFEKDDQGGVQKRSMGQRALDEFKNRVAEFHDLLSSYVSLARMLPVEDVDEHGTAIVHDPLLSHLNRCLTGDDHPIALPPVPMYLDAILGYQDVAVGLTPKIGEKFVVPVAITGFPHKSMPAILSALDTIDSDYRWSTRFIFMDAEESISQLKKYRRKWAQKVVGLVDQIFKTANPKVNEDAQLMTNEVDAAINDVNSGLVAYGFYTTNVILMGPNLAKLQEDARYFVKCLNRIGFAGRIETVNAFEAYLGSLPGHPKPNVRRPPMNTLNLADLLPLSSIWPGHNYNPCPFYPPNSPPLMRVATSGSTPLRLNLHVEDLGHSLVFGPPGSGKSTLLALIAAQARRYPEATVFFFDKGNSIRPLSTAVGGTHYDIGADTGELAFCPLRHVKSPADYAWYTEWVGAMCELQKLSITPPQRNEIYRAAQECVANRSYSMTEFVGTVQDAQIKAALEPYTLKGAAGHLLDASDDSLNLSTFCTFEIEQLMEMDEKFALPVLLYLFWRIERALKGQPAWLFLDEAWLMLAHPVFRAKIEEWLRVLRRANCAVVLATQAVGDAIKSGLLDMLRDATSTKIFLPNVFANSEEALPAYRALGLNATEVNIVARARKKRQYYYASPEGRRLFELALGPVALSFVGVSGRKTLAKIAELRAEHGETWPQAWLDSRGVDYRLYEDGAEHSDRSVINHYESMQGSPA